jgi:ribose-phosphate pyrophosphokinase
LYEGDHELFSIICLKKHLDRHFVDRTITLYMPYIPHARMDRVKNNEDVFTLKAFCETINSLEFTTVFVRDAHSSVSLGLLNRVVDIGMAKYVQAIIEQTNIEALFFPDEGAMKRYSSYFQMPYAFGVKNRNWETGEITGLSVVGAENIKDKRVLIVDDICSRGGTFYHSANALQNLGAANVFLYITHLEDTILAGDLPNSGLIDHVFTTKSIFPAELEEQCQEWITVIY